MNTLNLIVGPSGCGKDYLVNKVCKLMGLNRVKSRTTRNPRYIGESSYKFKTLDEWFHEKSTAIAPTFYCNNYYWVIKEDLIEADLYIVEPSGIDSMSKIGINFNVIYINTNIFIRIYRMFKRGDKLSSIVTRIINDYKDFKGVKHLATHVVNNEKEFLNLFTIKNEDIIND